MERNDLTLSHYGYRNAVILFNDVLLHIGSLELEDYEESLKMLVVIKNKIEEYVAVGLHTYEMTATQKLTVTQDAEGQT